MYPAAETSQAQSFIQGIAVPHLKDLQTPPTNTHNHRNAC